MNNVLIQWLDSSGWSTTVNADASGMNGDLIRMYMEQAQRNFPGKRIRAVDEDGRILDIL